MNYISFLFHPETNDQSEQLIAILSNLGFEGFEEDGETLKAFVPEANFDKDAFNELIDRFPSFTYQKEVIEPVNWNAQWESGFEPVTVDGLAVVRANFHDAIPGVKYDIIITPKMSFGTGHHATTYLMMQQMGKLDFNNTSVFDFGTGTGVLAILAEKMGASAVDAIDNDEWSIENGKENIEANGCTRINIYKAEQISPSRTYDIILANINLNVILASLPAIANISKAGSIVLVSGFLKENEAEMAQHLLEHGFVNINIFQKGDWLCISCEKQ